MRKSLVFLVILLLGNMEVKGQTLFGEEEQIVSTTAEGTEFIHTGDLDGDGDMDIVSANDGGNKIVWYENDGNGIFGEENIISTDANLTKVVYAFDLDQDGYTDIISASAGNGEIVWYENLFNTGYFGEPVLIATEAFYVLDMNFVDIDEDGDLDVIAPLSISDQILCYKNDGGNEFTQYQIIADEFDGIERPFAINTLDLDGDGDLDIVSTSYDSDKVFWHECAANGDYVNHHLITADADAPCDIISEDIDNDGDIDIIVASFAGDEITWYVNNGENEFDKKRYIDSNIDRVRSITSSDLDRDGDSDLLAASETGGNIFWYKNNGDGSFSSANVIETQISTPRIVHISDLNTDGDLDIIATTTYSNKIVWYENLTTHTKVTALTYLDFNENGSFDIEDKSFANQVLRLEPLAEEIFVDETGYSHYYVNYGDYTLNYEKQSLWELTTENDFFEINYDINTVLPVYHFGLKPTRTLPRVRPHLSSSPTRCNTTVNYWLNYSNTGTTIVNGTITLEVDDLMDFIVSDPQPNKVEGNTLIWNFSDLFPSFKNKIHLQFQMPDFNSIGEILETQASLQLFNDNEELVYTKSTEYNSEVRCSYDPNDKLASSNLLGQSEFAYVEDTIYYTIRFQNTGNDVAFNIRVEDVLDKKMDLTTFHPITASHDYRTELNRETGLATFFFDDIMLPDSTTNEVESHGFVTFAIASLAGVGDKTEVENTANIFFDFNPAIVTNTVVNTLIEVVETDIEVLQNGASIRVFPNPFSDYTTIEVGGLLEENYRLELMDILGRKVRELKPNGSSAWKIEREDLESGVYLYRVLTDSNRLVGSGKILIE